MFTQLLFLLLASLALAAPRPYIDTTPSTPLEKRASNYWMSTVSRAGTVAYGSDPNYKIFRNVQTDYNAKGDGVTDDTDAINRAIADGNRCGGGDCDSSTITPAIVYFPPGTYLIKSPIIMYYYTQMIGDAFSMPVLKGTADFNTTGLALIDADPYIVGGYGAGWYQNQNNFYRQIKNIVIDMTDMPEQNPGGGEVNGIHWQVAQACSMQNVVFNMKPPSTTNRQRGIMMENGSGMFMADVVFNGGNVGAYLGSQQFTTRNFTFNNCNTAIQVNWNWLWTFKSLNINNCQVGLNMSRSDAVGNETVGSAILMDSKISASQAAIITSYGPNTIPEAGSTLLIHNVDFGGSAVAVQDVSGKQILAGNVVVDAWGQGNAYIPSGSTTQVKRAPQNPDTVPIGANHTCTGVVTMTSIVTVSPTPRGSTSRSSTISFPTTNASNATATIAASKCSGSAVIPTQTKIIQQQMNKQTLPSVLLDSSGAVFERSKPQYLDTAQANFISVKKLGAVGDGITDDSDAIQGALNTVTTDQILYFDHGAYYITKTIEIPSNIKITGEIWPLIMIGGDNFQDVNNPQVAIRVGKPGDTGNVEISDLIFETRGPAPGAIMMEWNVQEETQGSCGMWDSHFRVGGTAGTELQLAQCEAGKSKAFDPNCAGSFLMMHVTQSASAYFENTWFWVADHDLDLGHSAKNNPNQTSIFNGRGVFIESQGPVWLWGTSSEHSQLYNYQLSNAKNIFMGSIQTETAYMQSAPNALNGGFAPNAAYSDPDFADCTDDNCKKTWGLRILDSSDIYMFGGGLYSFFDDYTQTCLEGEECQTNMIDIECSTSVHLYGLVTKAATNQITVNGQPAVLEKDNPNLFGATVLLYEQQ